MIRNSSAAFIALLLAGCGGGGSDSPTQVSASPDAPAATPSPGTPPAVAPPTGGTPPAVAPPVAAFPTPAPPIASPGPVTAPTPAPSPVTGLPAAPPPGSPPSTPPATGPQQEYVSGRLVKVAIASKAEHRAYEVVSGTPDTSRDMVYVGSSLGANSWTQGSQPQNYLCWSVEQCGPQNVHQYSYHDVRFEAWLQGTDLVLGQNAHWTNSGRIRSDSYPPLTRSEPFVIRDADQFAMDTTIAQWQLAPLFVQLQVSTYQPSNTVFRLCLHLNLDQLRRLSCTLHDKQTGVLRGAQVLNDSAGQGTIEYRTVQ